MCMLGSIDRIEMYINFVFIFLFKMKIKLAGKNELQKKGKLELCEFQYGMDEGEKAE